MISFTAKTIIRRFADNLVDGTRILASDRELIVESNGDYVPEIGDKPFLNGEYWTIVDIITKSPAGTSIVYFLQVRR